MAESRQLLIYGAYGYSGELAAKGAREHGLEPVLAGRRKEPTEKLALELDLPWRVFDLDDADAIDHGLEGIGVVLHCAGPFENTAGPMAKGCIRNGAHYLDITGEIAVFESLARMSARAEAAGVMLLPGVGFDVVPTDCLARHLSERLPGAFSLELAFTALGRLSHGTATTALRNIDRGCLVRRGGAVVPVAAGAFSRRVDFGPNKGERICVSIPWGDVSTAWHSTGIPNITVYTAMPTGMRVFTKLSRHTGGLLRTPFVQKSLKKALTGGKQGPSDDARERSRSWVWGEVSTEDGRRATARLETPGGYTLTRDASLHIAKMAAQGNATPGFQTPATAYGKDVVLDLPDVVRTDI